MLRDEEALVRAIWADPWDDLARSAYADWLEEHGKPAHAQLLRLPRKAAKQRGEALAGLLPCLRDGFPGAELQASAPDGLLRARFGVEDFLSRRFEREGRDWLQRHHVVEVELTGELEEEDHAGFSASPALSYLRAFANGCLNSPSGLAALASSPHLAGLLSLDLSSSLSDASSAVRLLKSGALPGLCRLVGLTVTGPRAPLVDAIEGAPCAANLRHLAIPNCLLAARSLRPLACSPRLSGLVTLSLSGNPIVGLSRSSFAEPPHLEGLRNLDLGNNLLADADLKALARSPLLPRLNRLRLARCHLATPTGLLALVEAVAATPHCRMVFEEGQIDTAVVRVAKEALGGRFTLE